MRKPVINLITKHLKDAEDRHQGVDAPSQLTSDLSIKEAYYVQLQTIQSKVNDGQRIVGKKIGLTSLAMQQLLGVGEPDYGHLLDQMCIQNHGIVTSDKVLQPKVEGELAFILGKELKGPHITKEDVLEATQYIVPAIEIVDSRVANWKIKLVDTIADNASSGLYVLGDQKFSPDQFDLAAVKMDLFKNGEWVNSGFGKDVMGHPAEAVAWLANKMAEFDISLGAGEVILSGAISAAANAAPGDRFHVEFEQLGTVHVAFVQ